MAGTSQIKIHQMIIHKVDHHNYDTPLLSDLESPVDDTEVLSFLRKHITDNREHRHSRKARFRHPDGQSTTCMAVCDSLLADPSQFILQSRKIAMRLFKCMDNRVSPGDLILATYTEQDAQGPMCLALLKMDPEDGFVGEREPVNGKYRVVLRRVPNVLPTAELQKCAFILNPSLREAEDYDLIVLDQQIARYGARRLVASFFSKDFLQSELALEPAFSTEQFYYESYDWIDQREEWSSQDRALAKQCIKDALAGKIVDATHIAAEITGSAEEQQAYLAQLKDRGLDLVFEPDPGRREQLLKYVHYEGDHELSLKVLSAAIGPDGIVSWEKQLGTGLTVVTIKTAHWQEKPK